MKIVNFNDQVASAVEKMESQFRTSGSKFSTERFNKAEAMKDPRNDEVLAALLVQWSLAENVKVSTGTSLIAIRSVVADAERANRKAQEAAENAREDVRNRYIRLGLPLPEAFHEQDCECEGCWVPE